MRFITSNSRGNNLSYSMSSIASRGRRSIPSSAHSQHARCQCYCLRARLRARSALMTATTELPWRPARRGGLARAEVVG